MADRDDRERGEQPARSYGVHWPSNPKAPGASEQISSEVETQAPEIAPGVDPSTSDRAPRVVGEPISFPPPPPIAPIPPVVTPTPAAAPRVSPDATAPDLSASVAPSVAPSVEPLPPVPLTPAPAAPPSLAPDVLPPEATPQVLLTREPSVPAARIPESDVPVIDAIPIPTSSPGLPVDPLFGELIPTPSTSSVPSARPERIPEETSGMSRRELRRLREQAAERIGDVEEQQARIDAAPSPSSVSSPSPGSVAPRVQSPYEVSSRIDASPGTASASAPAAAPASYGQPNQPLSNTLPGVPAVAAELAAITGRLDIIEAGQDPSTPVLPAAPTAITPSILPERVIPANEPLGSGLDSRLPSVSTTGGVPTSGHSLVVTNIPTDVPSALSAMNETGEIIVTGQIILPSSVAQTGSDSRRLDTSEIDVVHEHEAHVTSNTGRLAPVSATRAVSAFSSSTSAGTVVRGTSHRMSTALIIMGAAIGVIALGAFVTYLLMNILGK